MRFVSSVNYNYVNRILVTQGLKWCRDKSKYSLFNRHTRGKTLDFIPAWK